eukprot:Gb_13856 [translate_table: standard]
MKLKKILVSPNFTICTRSWSPMARFASIFGSSKQKSFSNVQSSSISRGGVELSVNCNHSFGMLRAEEVRELTEVFRYFDADGDGKISMAELRKVVNSVGEDELREEEVRGIMKQFDSDGDGFIDLHDFIRLNTRRAKEEEEEELLEAFRMFDMEEEGCITPKALQRMMIRLGHVDISVDECRLMIKKVDFDGDGVVSFQEFKHMMTTPH